MSLHEATYPLSFGIRGCRTRSKTDGRTTMETFLYGAFGALLHDIILFWSKRFTAPLLKFSWWQYLTIMVVYVPAAGFAATLYPYGGSGPTPWVAVSVGFGLPTLLSGVVAVADRAGRPGKAKTRLRGPAVAHTGESQVRIPATIIDLLALV
jgi:hypothetical protein